MSHEFVLSESAYNACHYRAECVYQTVGCVDDVNDGGVLMLVLADREDDRKNARKWRAMLESKIDDVWEFGKR